MPSRLLLLASSYILHVAGCDGGRRAAARYVPLAAAAVLQCRHRERDAERRGHTPSMAMTISAAPTQRAPAGRTGHTEPRRHHRLRDQRGHLPRSAGPSSIVAQITLPSLGGEWRDSSSNSGTFVTFGAATGGNPRPHSGDDPIDESNCGSMAGVSSPWITFDYSAVPVVGSRHAATCGTPESPPSARARVPGAEWDDANVGLYSTALGHQTTASGNVRYGAWQRGNGERNGTAQRSASSRRRAASGAWHSAAHRRRVESSAPHSGTTPPRAGTTAPLWATPRARSNPQHRSGEPTQAIGHDSVAAGHQTTAAGAHAFAMGDGSQAAGGNSLAVGVFARAHGFESVAMGLRTTTLTQTAGWRSAATQRPPAGRSCSATAPRTT